MDLSGNIFFNVTLSFWTNSSGNLNNAGGNLLSRKSPSSLIETHLPAKATAAATAAAASIYEAAISDKPPLGNNETSTSTISSFSVSSSSRTKSALLQEDLVKLVLIKEGKGNSSIGEEDGSGVVLSDDSVDIINRHINGGHLFDSLDLHRGGNQSDHSSIGNSLASSLSSHYRDASLSHQQSLPSLTSITEGESSTLDTLQAWNSSIITASNWTNVTHLNNALSESVACLDDLTTGGCLFRSTTTSSSINLTHGLDLESHEREYWALFLILLPILALFGNVLVILSVYRERSLQTVTNWFIVSLAFADLFVTIPMLFSLYVMVNVDWELSDLICDLYIAIDVICSTASIFNLVAISFDRYIAVTHPIFYSKHKNDKRVIVTILVVWMASSGVGLPIMLGANTSPERTPTLCIFYNSDFIIYSSLWSFYVPCLIMVILYYKIFKAIHDRARKKIDSQKGKPSSNNNANVSKNNVATIKAANMQTLENVQAAKTIALGKSNAIKMEQIKVPIESKNHIQTSVAVISEINIATTENNNSNNTESHLEDEEEEDEEDLEEGEEIEIKQLNNNRRSSQFNSLDGTCNCSIYGNASDKLNNANLQGANALPLKAAICQHRLCQKANQDAVVDIEPGREKAVNGGEGHLATTMFIVENASTSFKLQHSGTSNSLSSRHTEREFNQEPTLQQHQSSIADVHDSLSTGSGKHSPSASTSATGRDSAEQQQIAHQPPAVASVAEGSCKNGTNCRPPNGGEILQLANHATTPTTTILSTTTIAVKQSVGQTLQDNGNGQQAHNESSLVTKCSSKKKSRFNLGRKHKSSRKKREKASAKRERKATKTLAIVLGVFLLCWVPFFSCNILDAICIKLHENHFIQSDCRPGMTAFLLTTWLGYMNSCANPLIYTIFNPEFRKAFRKILCQF